MFFRLFGCGLLFICPLAGLAQEGGPIVDRVDIQYVGPHSVSEQFIRSHIRVKAGQVYSPAMTDADVHSLYGTGQFYDIRVAVTPQPDGNIVVTYVVQANLRITDVTIEGNKWVKTVKIKKKITVKSGEALDEEKLFEDTEAIRKLYEKYGYPGTKVRYVLSSMDEAAGTASVSFQIQEAPKIRIVNVIFSGARAFPQKMLRKQIKTRRHWMFSWITGSGVFKRDQFDDDREILAAFYHNHGYLDFEIKAVHFDYPRPNQMVIVFHVFEGRQYHVGTVTFTGNRIFNDAAIRAGLRQVHDFQRLSDHLGTNNLPMDAGDVYTAGGLDKDLTAIEDFYGSRGYINVQRDATLIARRIPNVETGTIDLQFDIQEGSKTYVERVDIHGNVKTKDKVIRRELAIAPGEVFDMVRVKLSKERLQNLEYFSRVDMEPEPLSPPIPGRQNLEINVQEQDTGNFTLGAGFSSVDALVGYAEITQGNFDLFHPPYFTGGGEKLRLFVQLGTLQQDYQLDFIEPWLFNRKLQLGVSLYRQELDFESPNDVFNETRTGARFSLTRALGSDNLLGTVSYTIENMGISLTGQTNVVVPNAIQNEVGDHLFHRFGASLAYDTRNSVKLPNHGQRTEIDPELDIGHEDYYKVQALTEWYFPGLFNGHVLEVGGRAGFARNFQGGDVPFYDRYYLGGLYDLRGFKYRNISPRESDSPEPIGGDSFWFASAEYSVPIFGTENGPSLRFAVFYDVGAVGAGPFDFAGNFDDDYGAGIRLDIPHLGPLRLDYGIPINHDAYNGKAGHFQFDVGYTRPF
ncbi:MAG: outer membrane protein assembly factor BamA [Verrucomicrobia bacterium]|nr:outer membrane protein assembly factor BamA [Verrucomicrobiota bacterium]